MTHSLSRLCPAHIRQDSPYRYRTLKNCAFSSSLVASYALSVRRASVLPMGFLRIPPRDEHPCLRLTIPPVGFVRDFHPQVSAPCRAHAKKRVRQRTHPRQSIGHNSPIYNESGLREGIERSGGEFRSGARAGGALSRGGAERSGVEGRSMLRGAVSRGGALSREGMRCSRGAS